MPIVDDFYKATPSPTVFLTLTGHFGGVVTVEHVEACISDTIPYLKSVLISAIKEGMKRGEPATSIGVSLPDSLQRD